MILTLSLFSGTVVGNAMSGAIIEATGSWANVFYIAGAAGCIWFVIFMFLCYGDPSSHPFITEKEKLYLKAEVGKYFLNYFIK